VLRLGGSLLAGMMSPSLFLFDDEDAQRTGVLSVKYRLPFSSTTTLVGEEEQRWLDSGDPAEFSHSLDAQLGGQLDAGFVLVGLYEDNWRDDASLFNHYAPVAMATWAVKPARGAVTGR
jgi:hypothetical protein